jgi:hypothetical protein
MRRRRYRAACSEDTDSIEFELRRGVMTFADGGCVSGYPAVAVRTGREETRATPNML